MCERDKVTLSLIEHFMPTHSGKTFLHIGCYNDNLLDRIKTALSKILLCGADIFPEVIAQWLADPNLAGMEFDVMLVRNL